MKEIRVGIIGFGTVGSGLAQTIYTQQDRLSQKTGLAIVLARVADIHVKSLPPQFKDVILSGDAEDIFNDPTIDIVVELIGGIEPARSFILKAIAKGKHVVTANKALLSVHGREIFAAAVANDVEVGFEASVGGGIPVIKSLKEGLVANRIEAILGHHERYRQLHPHPDDRSRHTLCRGLKGGPAKRVLPRPTRPMMSRASTPPINWRS